MAGFGHRQEQTCVWTHLTEPTARLPKGESRLLETVLNTIGKRLWEGMGKRLVVGVPAVGASLGMVMQLPELGSMAALQG